jgi:hypothetical protein
VLNDCKVGLENWQSFFGSQEEFSDLCIRAAGETLIEFGRYPKRFRTLKRIVGVT